MKRPTLAAILLVTALGGAAGTRADEYSQARARLVAEIETDARATWRWTGRRGFDERILDVIGRVPRHFFVADELRPYAYDNRPLPIGYGQTISQPYIVALMTDLLGLGGGETVLEVGTGSGYQAAILAELGVRVHTIEIIEPLAARAKQRLATLGYPRVTVRHGDGYHGWREAAPFDAVIVTAAASHIPPPLIRQLKPGGRMVIPVGARFLTQWLVLVEKGQDGGVTTRQILPVRFVPFTGKH